jgi:hypothetical protein
VDENKTTGDIELNFWLDLPETYFGPGKYPTLQDEQKIDLIRIN